MANLNRRDIRTLENYLQMEGGHLLDFSHRTLANFFEDFDIDIEEEVYQLGSGSKANKMRGFWNTCDEVTVGKVLLGLIDYYDEQRANTYQDNHKHSDDMRTKCIGIANLLVSGQYGHSSLNSPQPIPRSAQQPTWPLVHQLSQRPTQQPVQKPIQHPTQQPQIPTMTKQKVFIVHGHDEVLRLNIENFIQKIGLSPIILMDQANGGNTIIEKIEEYGAVDYAIVLYTPCDEGRKIGSPELNSRARQNVVFEHGYFIAKLGRHKVSAIVKQGVEIQNDIQGVVYIGADSDWKTQLLKEFNKAGLKFDAHALYA